MGDLVPLRTSPESRALKRRLRFRTWPKDEFGIVDPVSGLGAEQVERQRIVWIDMSQVRRLELVRSWDAHDHETGPSEMSWQKKHPGWCLVKLDDDADLLWIGIPFRLLLAEWRGSALEIADVERPYLHLYGAREQW